jgi:acyl-CoA thioesterase-1
MRILLVLILSFCLGSPAWASRNILVFGDSLSAGFGLPTGSAWPDLLQQRLQQQGLDYRVANHSISGETTAGGLSRFAAALNREKPAIVILELGANDGLRGLPLKLMQDNLSAMIRSAKAGGARVLLLGMQLPPNYALYADGFAAAYPALARRENVPLLDFLFAGFADRPDHFLPDGLHPTAAAQYKVLDNVWPKLKPLLR